jgi:glycosyltransferase involved in cell wall biosynthesis
MKLKRGKNLKTDTISIIVPLYKGKKYINRIIEMLVINYKNFCSDQICFELVFINDYPQEIIEVPAEIHAGISIKVLTNEKNEGIHKSKIKGLLETNGEYVLFLDQDDTIMDHYFIRQVEAIKEYDLVISNGLYRNGEPIFSTTNLQRKKYTFETYLKNGYPLISLGQILIRRKAIPEEWIFNCMKQNGWDDHFLWAIMMYKQAKVNINEEVLYIHEEDGSNASFNWKQMILSCLEFRGIFLSLQCVDENQISKFIKLIDQKIYKYSLYEELDNLWKNVSEILLKEYFYKNNYGNIAIYGMGIYGNKLFSILKRLDVNVKYIIDQKVDVKNIDITKVSMKENLEEVDVIIVTPLFDFEYIKKRIEHKVSYKVISLYEIMKECNFYTQNSKSVNELHK